ncbi:MAG: hypothetical protein R2932_20405 [Caldilineaceae bacterium]
MPIADIFAQDEVHTRLLASFHCVDNGGPGRVLALDDGARGRRCRR